MRRTRFTVTVRKHGDTTKVVILAPTSDDARYFYARRGYDVLSVVKGDFRREQRNATVQQGGGFTIDRAALKDACDLLGLKVPVRIRFSSKVGRTLGNYRGMSKGYHDIMLKSYRTAEQASSTLWHELTHAMQAERAGGHVGWQAELAKSYGKYKRCPLEIEARQMQATMADVMLCR